MRILFVGSIPDHIPGVKQPITEAHEPFFAACRDLGSAAAARGHRILIGSSSKRTADYHICEGVFAHCRQHPAQHFHIERHYPDDERPEYDGVPNNLHFLDFSHHADQSSPHKWIVAHARAVDVADVVVLIGGGVSTRIVGHLSADRGKPVVAVSCFGGTSDAVFHTMKYRYLANPDCASHLPFLTGTWNADAAAGHVMELASALGPTSQAAPHRYFISYNWADCSVADHVETLLRRENRPVLRDEANVSAGDRLSKAVEALIEESDTFVALWSTHYQSSSWCPHELEWAFNLQHRQQRPSRIALLALDPTAPPLRITDNLRCDGSNRSARELVVMKLMQSEENRP
jgi:hypothetical protein